jgi:HEAT repeat protein
LLLERLEAPGTWEKPAVLVALGRIGSVEAVPALLLASDHPAHWVRVCALHALGEIGVPEARSAALSHTHDVSWAVRGAAAIALGAAGGLDDLPTLLELLRDDHPWPRRGATYAIGRLGLAEAAPRVREELNDPAAEVRLAAIWALGRLADDGARDELVRLLYGVRPGDADDVGLGDTDDASDAPLRSDAESRLFDAAVQALGRLSRGSPDPQVHRALLEVRERLSEEELDRLARLPHPEIALDQAPPTLRALFEIAIPSSGEDEDVV